MSPLFSFKAKTVSVLNMISDPKLPAETDNAFQNFANLQISLVQQNELKGGDDEIDILIEDIISG